MSSAPERPEVVAALALSALPPDVPSCARYGPWPGSAASGPVMAWALFAAGARPDDVAAARPEEEVRLAREVRELPPAAQRRWFGDNVTALSRCDRRPELRPERYRAGAPR
ncbi:hypothetical protein [Streptomyces sp. NPDC050856]|uniref:DUF7224 domain-containing protein n=1 Tax=Streptomyces sp. NPDC050856 TaxID=3154939 RepID=UPI0033CA05AE